MEKITYIICAGFFAMTLIPVISNIVYKEKNMYYSDPKNYFEYFKSVFNKTN